MFKEKNKIEIKIELEYEYDSELCEIKEILKQIIDLKNIKNLECKDIK